MEIEEVNVMSKAHREPVAKCREQTLPLAKYKFWLLVDIDMDKYDECAERINITLPHRLLHRIDTLFKANPEDGSRSGFIAAAARKGLQKTDQ